MEYANEIKLGDHRHCSKILRNTANKVCLVGWVECYSPGNGTTRMGVLLSTNYAWLTEVFEIVERELFRLFMDQINVIKFLIGSLAKISTPPFLIF